ncbi:MAG: hypothetical protein JWN04_2660, partial [Myxococcaceae bacterium]|nr:hypothetical protein [Myxococcaceae bacterium]
QTPSATFGSTPSNFLTIGQPLLKAFDSVELRDPVTTLLTDGYMFGHLLSVFHKHWPVKKNEPCPATVEPGNEGCTQSLDPTLPLYAAQSGLSTYEELLADSFDDQGFVEALHKATVALKGISVTGVDGKPIDGITALANFVTRLVTPDPMLMRRDGGTTSQSNSCKVVAGACENNVGRFIPVLSPIVMIADALKRFDDAFKEADNKARLDVWHQGRSGILDQVLSVDKTGSGDGATYKLRDRTAYNIAMSVLPWAIDLLNKHRTASDLDTWAAGLSDRAAKVMRHPLAGAVVDLLDAFWPEAEASGEFTAVASYLTDETNESSYLGMLTALADSAVLLDRDGSLSPAIQFAALGLAPNAFQAIDGTVAPNGNKSVAYAGLELTGGVVKELMKTQKKGQATSLSKLLNNASIGDVTVRSPLEVLMDATADVNRPEPADGRVPAPQDPLTAEEDRTVFGTVKGFLYDDDQEKRSLERLYSVIQGRNVK